MTSSPPPLIMISLPSPVVMMSSPLVPNVIENHAITIPSDASVLVLRVSIVENSQIAGDIKNAS